MMLELLGGALDQIDPIQRQYVLRLFEDLAGVYGPERMSQARDLVDLLLGSSQAQITGL